MLIQSINPFHVVKLEPSTPGEVVATTVSMQGRIDDDWRYGHLYVFLKIIILVKVYTLLDSNT